MPKQRKGSLCFSPRRNIPQPRVCNVEATLYFKIYDGHHPESTLLISDRRIAYGFAKNNAVNRALRSLQSAIEYADVWYGCDGKMVVEAWYKLHAAGCSAGKIYPFVFRLKKEHQFPSSIAKNRPAKLFESCSIRELHDFEVYRHPLAPQRDCELPRQKNGYGHNHQGSRRSRHNGNGGNGHNHDDFLTTPNRWKFAGESR